MRPAMTWIKARVKPHPLEVGHPLELGHSVQGTPQAQIKAVKMEYQKCPDCGSGDVRFFCAGWITTETKYICHGCGAVFTVIRSYKRPTLDFKRNNAVQGIQPARHRRGERKEKGET